MKKLLHFLMCFSLILITTFSLVGCGNNPPEEPGDSNPPALVFSECFGFNEITTYSGGLYCISLDDLSQQGKYKSISLQTKKEFSFNQISFKITSSSSDSQNIFVSIKFGNSEIWNSAESYEVSDTGSTINCYYVQGSVSGSKYFNHDISNPNLTSTNYTIPTNTTVTIYIGTEMGSNISDPSNGEYTNNISFSDFSIK